MTTFRRARPTLHTAAAWRSAREAARSSDVLREFGAVWVFEARHGAEPWGPRQPVEPIPYQITRRASRARLDAALAALRVVEPEPDPPGRVRPFSNGTQYMDWQGSNCERCTKYNPHSREPGDGCDIEFWLSLGSVGDGTIDEDTARRCGYTEHQGRYVWPCQEVEWTEEWKAECERRKGAPQ